MSREARIAGWIQLLHDSRKLLEDAIARHRHQDLTVAQKKLKWLWEDMVSDDALLQLLAEFELSNRRPDELLEPIVDQPPSPETWRLVLQVWEAVGQLAESLRGRQA